MNNLTPIVSQLTATQITMGWLSMTPMMTPMMTPNPIAENIFAEIKCVRCKSVKWVAYELRHSGHKQPPTGIEVSTIARCRMCPSGADFCIWSGKTRWKGEAER